jgi:hypothetical protein
MFIRAGSSMQKNNYSREVCIYTVRAVLAPHTQIANHPQVITHAFPNEKTR